MDVDGERVERGGWGGGDVEGRGGGEVEGRGGGEVDGEVYNALLSPHSSYPIPSHPILSHPLLPHPIPSYPTHYPSIAPNILPSKPSDLIYYRIPITN